ncbi:MAG: nuclear transport factor 2 family protein [Chloroflexota bacterium]
MTLRPAHALIVERYIEAWATADPDRIATLWADDYEARYPQSGELVRGAEAGRRMMAAFPNPPRLVVGPFVNSCDDDLAIFEALLDYGGERWWLLSQLDLHDEKIHRETAFFAAPFDPAPWREALTERFDPLDPTEWAESGDGVGVDRAAIDRYAQAVVRVDLPALRAFHHRDYRGSYPQSGERYDDDGLAAIYRDYPGGSPAEQVSGLVGPSERWVVSGANTPVRVFGSGDTWFSQGVVTYPNGERWIELVVCLVRDGRIWRERAYFSQSLRVPEWRRGLVELTDPVLGSV